MQPSKNYANWPEPTTFASPCWGSKKRAPGAVLDYKSEPVGALASVVNRALNMMNGS